MSAPDPFDLLGDFESTSLPNPPATLSSPTAHRASGGGGVGDLLSLSPTLPSPPSSVQNEKTTQPSEHGHQVPNGLPPPLLELGDAFGKRPPKPPLPVADPAWAAPDAFARFPPSGSPVVDGLVASSPSPTEPVEAKPQPEEGAVEEDEFDDFESPVLQTLAPEMTVVDSSDSPFQGMISVGGDGSSPPPQPAEESSTPPADHEPPLSPDAAPEVALVDSTGHVMSSGGGESSGTTEPEEVPASPEKSRNKTTGEFEAVVLTDASPDRLEDVVLTTKEDHLADHLEHQESTEAEQNVPVPSKEAKPTGAGKMTEERETSVLEDLPISTESSKVVGAISDTDSPLSDGNASPTEPADVPVRGPTIAPPSDHGDANHEFASAKTEERGIDDDSVFPGALKLSSPDEEKQDPVEQQEKEIDLEDHKDAQLADHDGPLSGNAPSETNAMIDGHATQTQASVAVADSFEDFAAAESDQNRTLSPERVQEHHATITDQPVSDAADAETVPSIFPPPPDANVAAPPPADDDDFDDFGDFGGAEVEPAPKVAGATGGSAQPDDEFDDFSATAEAPAAAPEPVTSQAEARQPAPPQPAVPGLDETMMAHISNIASIFASSALASSAESTLLTFMEGVFPSADERLSSVSDFEPLFCAGYLVPGEEKTDGDDSSQRLSVGLNLEDLDGVALLRSLAMDISGEDPSAGRFRWRRSHIRKKYLLSLGVPVNLDDSYKNLPSMANPSSEPPGTSAAVENAPTSSNQGSDGATSSAHSRIALALREGLAPGPSSGLSRSNSTQAKPNARSKTAHSHNQASSLTMEERQQLLDQSRALVTHSEDDLRAMSEEELQEFLGKLQLATQRTLEYVGLLKDHREQLLMDAEMHNKMIGALVQLAQQQKGAKVATPAKKSSFFG
ncbi:hypothetical protein M427DRAFT_57948 [Gonapodya prolifera JEL478]|uniref:Uncharacterized protein n=1 Tax=Gonapodya prolifera (strain JEL478) TaxID=1344416 RepID=A0A139ABN0_GONPJ|nr:hypothetical protein M427DRAFT_57948 [Gonapodya prolifera JEL478]|eukprot:KXS14201.1 hypothetical protein M427DRAFT_57948 [Gonapodya prolifera JEL478]